MVATICFARTTMNPKSEIPIPEIRKKTEIRLPKMISGRTHLEGVLLKWKGARTFSSARIGRVENVKVFVVLKRADENVRAPKWFEQPALDTTKIVGQTSCRPSGLPAPVRGQDASSDRLEACPTTSQRHFRPSRFGFLLDFGFRISRPKLLHA